ncbi:MAG: transposase [Clostridia bacterium]|nr:transposase [Clostridia bacterium]
MSINFSNLKNGHSTSQEIEGLTRRCNLLEEKLKVYETNNQKLLNKGMKSVVDGYVRQLDDKDEAIRNKDDKIAEYIVTIKTLEEKIKDDAKVIEEKDAIIKNLEQKLAYFTAQKKSDGNCLGIPTRETSIDAEKRNPRKDINLREHTGRKKGKQEGTPRCSMVPPAEVDEEIEILHEPESTICDACGGTMRDTGKYIEKDEYDVEVKVVKRKHLYEIYVCDDCGKEYHVPISNNLKEAAQYGNTLKSLITSLGVTGNMPVNKIAEFVSGISDDRLHISEGYICKQYKNAATALDKFFADLTEKLIHELNVFWDDTVMMTNGQRANFRFYGNDKIALYFAHETKGMDGLIEDNILTRLSKDTRVIHDHNVVNYNERFHYINVECNQHLERDLKKITLYDMDFTWAKALYDHIQNMIRKRNELVEKGITSFSPEEIDEFWKTLDEILKTGEKEDKACANPYSKVVEHPVLVRLKAYSKEYFS